MPDETQLTELADQEAALTELAELAEKTAELVASNSARMNTLALKKININIQTLTMRHLIEVLFPTEEARAEMNLSFQLRLAEVLDDVERNADKIAVMDSVPAQELFIPKVG